MVPEDDLKPMDVPENNGSIEKPDMTPVQLMEFEKRGVIAEI